MMVPTSLQEEKRKVHRIYLRELMRQQRQAAEHVRLVCYVSHKTGED